MGIKKEGRANNAPEEHGQPQMQGFMQQTLHQGAESLEYQNIQTIAPHTFDMLAQMEALMQQMSALKEYVQNVEYQNMVAIDELQTLRGRIVLLENEQAGNKSELQQKTSYVMRLEARLDQASNQIDELNSKVLSLEQAKYSADQTVSELQDDVSALNSQLFEVTEQATTLEQNYQNLNSQYDQLQEEHGTLQSQIISSPSAVSAVSPLSIRLVTDTVQRGSTSSSSLFLSRQGSPLESLSEAEEDKQAKEIAKTQLISSNKI